MSYADIILPVPLNSLFTYAIPTDMAESVAFGKRVLVSFGPKNHYVGIIVRLHDNKPTTYKVKPIEQVLDDTPLLLESQLRLWQWIADYYMSPIGDVYKGALPAGLKAEDGYKPRTETYIRLTLPYQNEPTLHVALNMLARAPRQQEAFISYLTLSGWDNISSEEWRNDCAEITREELMNASGTDSSTINQLVKRGLLETYEVEVGRLNLNTEPHLENIKPLSDIQQEAYNQILFSFMKKDVTLLHGVTSSGKTEIYIHLIMRELEQHRQVLFLMPEIALTVQMMERLQRVFGNRLGIYHSKYSDAERVEIWQKQLSGNPYDVILGARSAVFLPFQHLGLIIVDEEHETSYKQQDPAPRYHARSAAIMLAKLYNTDASTPAPKVLLGTATPCMETYHNAKTGKYGLVELTQRYEGIELPEIQIVDTKDLQHRKMMNGPFSPLLLARVREALERGEQAILFQNRRGWAPMLECKQCGWVPRCQHCDVSLTLHKSMNQLTCHYCGYTYQIPTECPACGCKQLQGRGYGTEKIEDQIRDILPEARISRMDLDTTRTRNAYERIISDFSSGRTNLLIGTQMISKGLDFGNVSVVGIISADGMLNQPDFRAYEHAYMMIAQVSGRAGRKGKRGLVILQTKNPDVSVIQQVVHNDFKTFYNDMKSERSAFNYPPYCHLIYVYMKHKKDDVVETASRELGARLRQWFGSRVLGPDKPTVSRVKTLSIRKLVLKLENGIDMPRVRQYLALAQEQMLQDKRYASLQVYYDVDPL
ncbi:primosomal protein N' [Prevotella sp. E13-27]|uniref:replication restart helicase PriA n=1 Tax=Prevotella sp. E13-27 TaxID=2938122 RepID=UPI00200A469A|nr:primosomal protein N' [Prevotella sp. E13-27]MCK8621187.1 primosomal protein N' [Prevotella sp. E13-27]